MNRENKYIFKKNLIMAGLKNLNKKINKEKTRNKLITKIYNITNNTNITNNK
jgi:hypothetical protein